MLKKCYNAFVDCKLFFYTCRIYKIDEFGLGYLVSLAAADCVVLTASVPNEIL